MLNGIHSYQKNNCYMNLGSISRKLVKWHKEIVQNVCWKVLYFPREVFDESCDLRSMNFINIW